MLFHLDQRLINKIYGIHLRQFNVENRDDLTHCAEEMFQNIKFLSNKLFKLNLT